jgi:hypothetical protein
LVFATGTGAVVHLVLVLYLPNLLNSTFICIFINVVFYKKKPLKKIVSCAITVHDYDCCLDPLLFRYILIKLLFLSRISKLGQILVPVLCIVRIGKATLFFV